ncbi:MAG: hypothetical protein H2060_10375 [Azoarcus sp.]|nr:hypothetical protein [Azoarcus sp.]
MRILTYKRTHTGDPDVQGRFGVYDCMGTARALCYDAVIGVGGVGPEPQSFGIDRRLTWIGLGPKRTFEAGLRAEVVEFEHFLLFEEQGPHLESVAPNLAKRMYEGRVRYLIDGYSEVELAEATALVKWCRSHPEEQRREFVVVVERSPCSPCSPELATNSINGLARSSSGRLAAPRNMNVYIALAYGGC